MKLFRREKIAKNSMAKVDRKVTNKIMEEKTMSEKKQNPVVEEETEEKKAPAKKPAAKKESAAKKDNILKRAWNCIKRNRKYIATAAGGVVVGAAGTYGVGKWQESKAGRRVQTQTTQQRDFTIDD